METKQKRAKVVWSVLALAGLVVFSLIGYAGSLEPSAPPGPTMKTLDEVEPRIPIQSLSGDANAVHVIAEPGSYYLTGNVNVVTDKHGIRVDANDVTIDLMGHTLRGLCVANGRSGIYMDGRNNVEVCNGTVRDFHEGGIYEDSFSGKQHRVINVRVMSNVSDGIYLHGKSHLVKDCTGAENGHMGIYAYSLSTVTGNTAYDNGDCGIFVAAGSTVTGNTAYENSADGIYIADDCKVTDNICIGNGYNGDGAGIHATGTGSHIERNNIIDNDRGIDVDSSSNVIADNVAKNNTDNYDIAADNQLHILLCEVPETISWPATVTLAGSLKLNTPDVNAITVDSNDVTIDLAGFSLIGPGSGTGSGIYMYGRSNVEIRNGTVRDFYGYGISDNSTNSKQHRTINIQAMSNENSSIYLAGKANLVKDCTLRSSSINTGEDSTVTGNTVCDGGFVGIVVSDGSTVTGNTVYDNDYGIFVAAGCTVTGNTAHGNKLAGIYAGEGCMVTSNTVYDNQGFGICADDGCTVTGNTVRRNNQANGPYDGIFVTYACVVKGNTVTSNKRNNIHVFGSDNAIEENLVIGSASDTGIRFHPIYGVGNFYANNRASGNGTDYANTGGQTDGGGNYSF